MILSKLLGTDQIKSYIGKISTEVTSEVEKMAASINSTINAASAQSTIEKMVGKMPEDQFNPSEIANYVDSLEHLDEAQKKAVISNSSLSNAQKEKINALRKAKVATEASTVATNVDTVAKKTNTLASRALAVAQNTANAAMRVGKTLAKTFFATVAIQLALEGIMWIADKIKDAFGGAAEETETAEERLQRIKQAAEEAGQEIERLTSNFKSQASTVAKTKDRYAELAQEVNNLGRATQSKGTLSTEEYEEFLDLSDELASVFPSLNTGFEDNGKAIINLKGNVDDIVSSLESLIEVQERLVRQETLKEMPKYLEGYIENRKAEDEEISDLEGKKISKQTSLRRFLSKSKQYNNDDKKYINKIAAVAGLSEDFADDDISVEEYAIIEQYANYDIQELDKKIEAAYERRDMKAAEASSRFINSWLSDNVYFKQIDNPDLQNLVYDALSSQDLHMWLKHDVDTTDPDAMIDYIQDNFLSVVKDMDEETKARLIKAFNGELNASEIYQLMDHISSDDTYDMTLYNPLYEYLEDIGDKKNEFDKYLNDVLWDYEKSDEEILEKFISEQGIDNFQELKYFNDVTSGAKTAEEAIIKYKNALHNKKGEGFEEIWKSSDFKEAREELLDLAKSGELTVETLESSSEYNEIIGDIGLTAKEAKKYILDMLTSTEKLAMASETLEPVGSALEEYYEEGFVTASTLEELPETIKELSGFDEFKSIVSNIESSEDQIRAAFNKLISEWIYQNSILTNVTQEEANMFASNLQNMGITNAQEIVKMIFGEYVTEQGKILITAENDFLEYLGSKNIAEIDYVEDSLVLTSQLVKEFGESYQDDYDNWATLLTDKVLAYNEFANKINETKVLEFSKVSPEFEDVVLSKDVDGLVDESLYDNDYDLKYAQAKEIQRIYEENKKKQEDSPYTGKVSINEFGFVSTMNEAFSTDWTEDDYNSAMKYIEAYEQSQKFRNSLTANLNLSQYTPENLGSDSDSNFDWIEVLFSRIESAVSNAGKKINATYKSWSDRTKAVGEETVALTKKLKAQEDAAAYYKNKANSVTGLTETEKNRIKNGEILITSETGEAKKKAIQDFQEYWEAYLAAFDGQQDTRDEIANNLQTDFDLIASEYDSKLGKLEGRGSIIDALIGKQEADGHIVSKEYYKELENLAKNKATTLQDKLKELTAKLNSGEIAEGTEMWDSLKAEIYGVEAALIDAKTEVIEYGNEMRQLDWDIFDKQQEAIEGVREEAEFFISLMEEEDLFDKETGAITEYGKATMGLHATSYYSYMKQAQDYGDELVDINKELQKDPYDQEAIERREELLGLQRDMILSAQDEKQAMIDLTNDGYDAMLEALDEIIEKKKEALNVEKDLYDYQKNVAEQTKNIASLEKQLAAYSGDDSEEAKAKVQQLKVSLDEAKQNLQETEYDKWKQDQEQMLDTLLSDTQEWINERLDNEDELLQGILDAVDGDSDSIKKTLETVANDVGYQLSEQLPGIFNEGGVLENTYSTLKTISDYVATIAGGSGSDTISSDSVDSNGETTTSGGNSNVSNGNNTNNNNNNKANNEETKAWGYWFVKQKSYYPKDKLEKTKNTSIVDRLAWLDYDNSFDARAKYFKAMGGSGVYTGSAKQNSWMLSEMKKRKGYATGSRRIMQNELAWTQENGQELIYRASDGAMLTPLGTGDAVFTAEMTNRLWDIANNPGIFSGLTSVGLPKGMASTRTNSAVQNDVVMNISLPNVVDVDGFVNELRTNKKFEKVVQSMTIGNVISGSNSLSKFKY